MRERGGGGGRNKGERGISKEAGTDAQSQSQILNLTSKDRGALPQALRCRERKEGSEFSIHTRVG